MPRIAWIEDDDAHGEVADVFAEVRGRHVSGQVPAILRTMSHQPGFLTAVNQAANLLHFQDGALSRAQHEMIASHVAAINHCHY
jgi:alkylhydroperoxidase family enzyme